MTEGSLVFGRYRLHEQVGVGGMGVVWRATDELLHQQIALKRVALFGLSDDDAHLARERTLREARVAAQLRGHPHVVALYDVEVDAENAWLVLEYLPSRSLGEIVRAHGPLAPGEVARVGADIADALGAAHRRGVLHRDVTPGNVLISADGTVKLTDFGISHLIGDPKLTQAGAVSGTLAYLAPEVANSGESSAASDVFSLGSTLYAALEGQPPFGTEPNAIKQLNSVRAGVIRPPANAGPLTPLLLRLLALDPTARPSAADAQRELDRFATGLSEALAAATAYLPPVVVRSQPSGPVPGAAGSAGSIGSAGSLPPARSGRASWLALAGAALAAVAVLLLVALLPEHTVRGTASPGPRLSTTTSTSDRPVPTTLPDSVGSVTVDGDPSTVDPCPLIDSRTLRPFGSVTVGRGPGLASCQARILPPNGGDVRLDISYAPTVSDAASLGGRQQNLGGLTVVHKSTVTEGPTTFCRNILVLSDNYTVYVNVYQRTGTPIDMCAVTETATNVAVNYLGRYGVTFTPDSASAFSLTKADACAAARPATLRALGAIKPDAPYAGFGNWSCSWGPAKAGKPYVNIYFQLDTLDNPNDYGQSTTVAGRTAYQRPQAGQYNTTSCTIYVIHRRAAGPGGRIEIVAVDVDSPRDSAISCRQAKDIAAGVEEKLP